MAIIYALIHCMGVPVADFSRFAGTFKSVCCAVVETRIDYNRKRITYEIEDHLFHVLINENETVVATCVTEKIDPDFVYSFLNDITQQFGNEFRNEIDMYLNTDDAPVPFEMNKIFSSILEQTMNAYNNDLESEFLSITIDPYHEEDIYFFKTITRTN
eukprot:TRINITY_DN8199_c0_g1_i1.p1 TRINITY_DN8199_c0_g1~~TRINITY_DN8199_c0_g1_i1.p1  ORF type:complete len:158 (-),score=31.45 TRINITY_DN8199_c0_g1_i1:277-750(-)